MIGSKLVNSILEIENQYTTSIIIKSIKKVILILVLLYFLKDKINIKYIYQLNWFRWTILIGIAYLAVKNVFQNVTYSNDYYYFFSDCLLIGFFEELFCRVFLFSFFLIVINESNSNRLAYASILASLFFGILHFLNFNIYYDINNLINQIFLAVIVGILFQFILIRSRDFFFVAIFHGVIDIAGDYKNVHLNENSEISKLVPALDYENLLYLTAATILFCLFFGFLIKKTKSFDINLFLKL